MQKVILLLTLLFISIWLNGQTIETDTIGLNDLLEKGRSLLAESKFDESIKTFEEVKLVAEKYKLWEMYFDSESRLIQGLWRKRELDKASWRAKAALKNASKLIGENALVLGGFYNSLGVVNILSGTYDSAIYFLDKCAEVGLKNGDKGLENVAATYVNKSYIYTQLGDQLSRLETILDAYEIDKRIYKGDHEYIADDLNNIGSVYHSFGMDDEALEYLSDGYEMMNRLGNEGVGYAGILSNIGRSYARKKEFDKAIAYLSQALEVNRKIYGNVSIEHVGIYEATGDAFLEAQLFDSGLFHFQKIHPYIEQLEIAKSSQLFYYYQGIAKCYIEKDEFEKALVTLDKGIAKAQTLSENNEFYRFLINLKGFVFLEQKEFDKAKSLFLESLKMYQQEYGNSHVSQAYVYINLAEVYEARRDYDATLKHLQESIKSSINGDWNYQSLYENPEVLEPGNWASFFEALIAKSKIFKLIYAETEDQQILINLIEHYDYLDKIVKLSRRSVSSVFDKLKRDDYFRIVYDGAIEANYKAYTLLDNPDYLERCFYFSESSKSATLLQSVKTDFAIKFSDIPAYQIELEDSIRRVVALYTSTVQSELSKRTSDSVRVAAYQKKQFDSKYSLDSLLSRLEKQYPLYYQRKYEDKIVNIQEVQRRLKKSEAIIEYAKNDSSLFSFTITQKDFLVRRIVLTSTFDSRVLDFQKSISGNQEKGLGRDAATSNFLYKTLLAQTIDELDPAAKKITIIPDGILHYIPFDILTSDSSDAQSYVINDYAINYAYSTTLYSLFNGKKGNLGNSVLAVAPSYKGVKTEMIGNTRAEVGPLLWNAKEVKKLSDFFDVDELLENEANEKIFKARANEYGILHLAMHALVDNENPLNSKFIFAGETDSLEDNNLHLSELHSMNLKAHLAVLSACETGYGILSESSGPMSLSNAFYYSGVPSVVMSYWNVDDQATSIIMSSFYKYLSEGYSKSEALRASKLEYLSTASPDKLDPFYWAAFAVIGDDSELETRSAYTKWILPVIVLILLFFVMYVLKKRLFGKVQA